MTMKYTEWLDSLEALRREARNCTFEANGLRMKPANGTIGTVEIKVVDKHIEINKEQAKSIILYLKEIFEL